MRVVVKVGTSSLTDSAGRIDDDAIAHVASEVASLRTASHGTPPHEVVVVSSGAVAAGLPALGWDADSAPVTPARCRRSRRSVRRTCWSAWNEAFARHDLIGGQVLLAPLDFMVRAQYLQARGTLDRLLELGVVPVVNENDAVADDEMRFGDNDRIAALVAQLLGADLLILLTDAPGLMDADPRLRQRRRADRGDRRDRPRARVAAPRCGHRPGQRRHGVEARRGQDGVVVGCASGHRRSARARMCWLDAVDGVRGVGTVVVPKIDVCRPASSGSRSRCPPRVRW